MKICPNCRRTYEDDGLNFCLEDGSLLTFASIDSAPTIVMEQARPTDPARQAPAIRTGWDAQNVPVYTAQPKKKSRTWIWILAIFAVLILVCGGGFAGFFFYVASVADMNGNTPRTATNSSTNKGNTFTRSTTTASNSGPEPTAVKEVDLNGWVDEPTTYLDSEYIDGEFFMTSKEKDYYYVLVAKDDELVGAPVSRVTVRNPDNATVSLGYGLVFHSEMTPLTNDYALLIDSTRKKYRVVRHENSQEKTITAWTSSNLIKAGAEPNLLEARDKGDKIELYINGQLANTITSKQGPKSGVPGLYVGDGAKIGFKELAIVK